MRQACASEVECRKSILERLEIGETVNDDRDVSVVRHLNWRNTQKQLWNESTHDSEWNSELA
jgi:hypothetical protein